MNACEESRRAEALATGVPRLKAVRLRRDYPENKPEYLGQLNLDHHYVVMGEVATTRHYLICNLTTGEMLRGFHHIERFEEIPEDDL